MHYWKLANKSTKDEVECTFPKDLLMLAWNASVGYSFDKTLSHPFVAQAGIRSHCKKNEDLK